MKFLIKPLSATCAALALSAAAVAPVAHADLSAAAGVANMYYWRGLQVSNGAQVWGQLTYTLDSGFYGDLWASSEGFGVGPEYDLSAGWAGKFGDFGVNVGAITYVYSRDSTGEFSDVNGNGTYLLEDSDPGDFSDIYVKLSFGPVFFNAYHNVALVQGQDWYQLGATLDKFTFAVGYQKFEDEAHLALGYPSNEANGDDQVSKVDYTYAEITYAATKNLSVTVSSIIDHDEDLEFFGVAPVADTNRAKVIVSYSLPIEF